MREQNTMLFLINIGNGDQFGSGFVEINPNSKIPAFTWSKYGLLEFWSDYAMLVYLAEKFEDFTNECSKQS